MQNMTRELAKKLKPGDEVIYVGRIDHNHFTFGNKYEVRECSDALGEYVRVNCDSDLQTGWDYSLFALPDNSISREGFIALILSYKPDTIGNATKARFIASIPEKIDDEILTDLVMKWNGGCDSGKKDFLKYCGLEKQQYAKVTVVFPVDDNFNPSGASTIMDIIKSDSTYVLDVSPSTNDEHKSASNTSYSVLAEQYRNKKANK